MNTKHNYLSDELPPMIEKVYIAISERVNFSSTFTAYSNQSVKCTHAEIFVLSHIEKEAPNVEV